MSIYQSRLKPPVKDEDVTQPDTPPGATGRKPTTVSRTSASQDWGQIWSHRRKAAPVKNLLPMSVKWLLGLPSDIRPLSLVAKYPRIANVLALQWGTPPACRAHFNDLLADRRGNRKGFPSDVHRELRALRDYYYDLHPPSQDLALVE